jgi:hypothetical protein
MTASHIIESLQYTVDPRNASGPDMQWVRVDQSTLNELLVLAGLKYQVVRAEPKQNHYPELTAA